MCVREQGGGWVTIRVPLMGFIIPRAMLTLPSSLAVEHLSSRGTPGLCCVAVH